MLIINMIYLLLPPMVTRGRVAAEIERTNVTDAAWAQEKMTSLCIHNSVKPRVDEDIQSCPQGSFPCGDEMPLQCVLQRFQCDDTKHCENGADENPLLCNDRSGAPTTLVKVTNIIPIIRNETNTNCTLTWYPKDVCQCKDNTFLYCKNAERTTVPEGIKGNLSRLILTNNCISSIPDGVFENYTQLNFVSLDRNNLQEIFPGSFRGMGKLRKLFMSRNGIRILHKGSLKPLQQLSWLVLDNNFLNDSHLTELSSTPSLRWLDLKHNNICLTGINFPPLKMLEWLELNNNCITNLTQATFSGLKSLEALFLQYNQIEYVHWKSFFNLKNLTELNLSYNRLHRLPTKLFFTQHKLDKLELSSNPFTKLPDTIFKHLTAMNSLNLEGIVFDSISVSIFASMKNVTYIVFKKFHYCSFAPLVRVCKPNTDGVSSTEQLLVNPVLRSSVWMVAALTCLGNSLVLLGRFLTMEDNRVLSIFIRNLSAADLLMGIYLLVIGSHDLAFRDMYNQHANAWMSSWGCALCGILALTSSETSVLMLAFMSIERCICISRPLSGQRITVGGALTAVLALWVTGFTLAVAPLLKWSPNIFYGSNGMCFPLHIDDPFITGWQYSAFVLIGVNLICVVAIGIAYSAMFISIQRTRKCTPLAIGEREFAMRFFFIVLTDCLCWIPIIFLKIFAMAYMPVTGNLYAWLVVFILPINSAINPFLYTFTTSKFRTSTKQVIKALASTRKSSSIIDTDSTVAALFKVGESKISKTSSILESRA